MCNCNCSYDESDYDLDDEPDKIETIYLVFKRLEDGGLKLGNVCFFTDKYQASDFVENRNRLLGYVRKFAEIQKTNPLKIPEFSKPEPVLDLVKRKELTDAMNKGEDRKQRRAAGKAFERFRKEFDSSHSEWLKEKNKFLLETMANAVESVVNWKDYRFSDRMDIVTSIIDLYTKGESHYTDFIYEFETIQTG